MISRVRRGVAISVDLSESGVMPVSCGAGVGRYAGVPEQEGLRPSPAFSHYTGWPAGDRWFADWRSFRDAGLSATTRVLITMPDPEDLPLTAASSAFRMGHF